MLYHIDTLDYLVVRAFLYSVADISIMDMDGDAKTRGTPQPVPS